MIYFKNTLIHCIYLRDLGIVCICNIVHATGQIPWLEIYGAIEIHVGAERTSAPRVIVHKYQCGLPVQGFTAVLFEPEYHGDGVIRLAGLYITRQDCLLTRHPLYRLHGYWNTHQRLRSEKCPLRREKTKNNETRKNRRITKSYGFFRRSTTIPRIPREDVLKRLFLEMYHADKISDKIL